MGETVLGQDRKKTEWDAYIYKFFRLLRIGTCYQTFIEKLVSSKSKMDMTRPKVPSILGFSKTTTVDRVTLFDKVTVEKTIQVKYCVLCIKIKVLKSTVYALYSSKFHSSSHLHTGNELCIKCTCPLQRRTSIGIE